MPLEPRLLLCEVWSGAGQSGHQLGVFEECRPSGPTPDQQGQTLYLPKVSRGFMITGRSEVPCPEAEDMGVRGSSE